MFLEHMKGMVDWKAVHPFVSWPLGADWEAFGSP
jgi:hypothetical protein